MASLVRPRSARPSPARIPAPAPISPRKSPEHPSGSVWKKPERLTPSEPEPAKGKLMTTHLKSLLEIIGFCPSTEKLITPRVGGKSKSIDYSKTVKRHAPSPFVLSIYPSSLPPLIVSSWASACLFSIHTFF